MKTAWDLKKYFYEGLDDPRLEQDIRIFEEKVDQFVTKYKGKIKNFIM